MNRVGSNAKFRRCFVFRADQLSRFDRNQTLTNAFFLFFPSSTKKQNEYLGMFVTLGSMQKECRDEIKDEIFPLFSS